MNTFIYLIEQGIILKGKIIIDGEICKGCYLCIPSCPRDLIKISEQLNKNSYYPAEFNDEEEKCTGCMLCALICPEVAIEVYKEDGKQHTKKTDEG